MFWTKVIMQGNLFQRSTHLLYCSVLSLGGNVNRRRMSKPDIFHIKNQWNILVIGNYYVNFQNYQNVMLLTYSDTKRILMHLFLFTNSARENWFQYVRRVYATAINFPCIITLVWTLFSFHGSIFIISVSHFFTLNLLKTTKKRCTIFYFHGLYSIFFPIVFVQLKIEMTY